MKNNVGGQIFVHAAKAIAHPSAKAGAARELASGLDVRYGGIVVDCFRPHRLDDAEFLGDRCHMRNDFGEVRAILVVGVLGELKF